MLIRAPEKEREGRANKAAIPLADKFIRACVGQYIMLTQPNFQWRCQANQHYHMR